MGLHVNVGSKQLVCSGPFQGSEKDKQKPRQASSANTGGPGAQATTGQAPPQEPASRSWETLPGQPPPPQTPCRPADEAHSNKTGQPCTPHGTAAPAFKWREQGTRLQLYMAAENTPLTDPPVLLVGPNLAIRYQSMPAGFWLAAAIRQLGSTPPRPSFHDGATVVASKAFQHWRTYVPKGLHAKKAYTLEALDATFLCKELAGVCNSICILSKLEEQKINTSSTLNPQRSKETLGIVIE